MFWSVHAVMAVVALVENPAIIFFREATFMRSVTYLVKL